MSKESVATTSLQRIFVALLPLSMYATSATIGNGQLNVHLYRYRNSDLWFVIGATAIVARLWTYHRLYDDILILLPMISLFRIASTNRFPSRANLIPVALLTIGWIAALAHARLLNSPPP